MRLSKKRKRAIADVIGRYTMAEYHQVTGDIAYTGDRTIGFEMKCTMIYPIDCKHIYYGILDALNANDREV